MKPHPTSNFNKQVEEYYSARWKNIRRQLKLFIKTKDAKALHATRVEIKKLTAILHLTTYCFPEFDGENELKPVLKIFRLLGKLRDHGNAHSFCHQYQIDKSVLKKEDETQNATMKRLKLKSEKFKHRFKKLERDTYKLLCHINAGKLNAYLMLLRSEISAGFNRTATVEQLHALRKKMKEVIYLSGLKPKSNEIPDNRYEVELLDKLQDLIGKSHDMDKFRNKMHGYGVTYKKNVFQPFKIEERKLRVEIRKIANEYLLVMV